jgi:hypothetical protein
MMPGLNDFLARLQTDYGFYFQFLERPEQALAPYQLTPEQRTAILRADVEPLGLLPKQIALLKMTVHFLSPESEAVDFDLTTSRARPEIQQAIDQIRVSNERGQRMLAVSTLIQHLA